MIALFQAASAISASENSVWYQRRENPSQSVKREALKLKTTSVTSGKWRNKYAPAA